MLTKESSIKQHRRWLILDKMKTPIFEMRFWTPHMLLILSRMCCPLKCVSKVKTTRIEIIERLRWLEEIYLWKNWRSSRPLKWEIFNVPEFKPKIHERKNVTWNLRLRLWNSNSLGITHNLFQAQHNRFCWGRDNIFYMNVIGICHSVQ